MFNVYRMVFGDKTVAKRLIVAFRNSSWTISVRWQTTHVGNSGLASPPNVRNNPRVKVSDKHSGFSRFYCAISVCDKGNKFCARSGDAYQQSTSRKKKNRAAERRKRDCTMSHCTRIGRQHRPEALTEEDNLELLPTFFFPIQHETSALIDADMRIFSRIGSNNRRCRMRSTRG